MKIKKRRKYSSKISTYFFIGLIDRFDPQLEAIAWNWIEALLEEKIGDRSEKLCTHLSTGVILCRIANKIVPGSIPKVHTKNIRYLFIV
jgi:hypothetical protein